MSLLTKYSIPSMDLKADELISMNDYPTLHSPTALRNYYDLYRENDITSITPIPVIPAQIVIAYFKQEKERFQSYSSKLAAFLERNPSVGFFMLDGTHRAAAAILAGKGIPTYIIKTDEDITLLLELRREKKINLGGLECDLRETIAILEEHYYDHKNFWTLQEKVKLMISNGDINQDLFKHEQ